MESLEQLQQRRALQDGITAAAEELAALQTMEDMSGDELDVVDDDDDDDDDPGAVQQQGQQGPEGGGPGGKLSLLSSAAAAGQRHPSPAAAAGDHHGHANGSAHLQHTSSGLRGSDPPVSASGVLQHGGSQPGGDRGGEAGGGATQAIPAAAAVYPTTNVWNKVGVGVSLE
jgi:hypothetical protein